MSKEGEAIISIVITVVLDIILIIYLISNAGKLLDIGMEQSATSKRSGIETAANISKVIDKKITSSNTTANSTTIYYEDDIIYHCISEYKDKTATTVFTFNGPQDFLKEKMAELVAVSYKDLSGEEHKDITDALLSKGVYNITCDICTYSAKYENGSVSFTSAMDTDTGFLEILAALNK